MSSSAVGSSAVGSSGSIVAVASATDRPGSATQARTRRSRFRQVRFEGVITILVLLAAWQAAATVLPPLLFPSLQRVATSLIGLVGRPAALATIALTYVRILVALLVSFAVGGALGVTAALRQRVDRACLPLMQLMQAVPAVCWAIFAILWFGQVEVRVAFVVIVATLPSFFYQFREGVRAISRDLWDMMLAWRPSQGQLFRKLMLPALVPTMLTALRINLGNGTRITITAELLGGISGIGYQLRYAQEMFRMDLAISWTVALIVFVLVTETALMMLEATALRWRASPGDVA